MKPVKLIAGTTAPLMVDNISTDVISPGSLYRTVNADFARGLFGPWRYHDDGTDNPAFVLNQPRYRDARILVAGRNFGCGSSREIAVWCLQRYGIGCVLAPSFGEIFFENASKNGLVAIELAERHVDALAGELASDHHPPQVCVDLLTKTVTMPSGRKILFDMDDVRRTSLLEGLDELQMILREEANIADFQTRTRAQHPWRFATPLPAQER
jgi:3-isopropylmalate/(R)-2-methylmalate dehydratase small subunit